MDRAKSEKSREGFKQPAQVIEKQQSISSAKSSDSSTSLRTISDSSIIPHSTPMASSRIIKKYKPYIYNFLENLFKINMSQDALVDIIINDDIDNNQIIIVGRPKILGSSKKQMRHVTPYSFVEAAIKATIVATEKPKGYESYINSVVKAIKPLIKSKEGICLTNEQYSKLSSSITLQDEESKVFKLSTIGKKQKKNEYHLIYNEIVITKFMAEECQIFSKEEKEKARSDFKNKFEKYINYGIRYLTKEIVNPKDLNAITITCEGIARIILTLFNQEKYAAFPEEGNSLLEEIRVYTCVEDAEQAATLKLEKQNYSVVSHAKITKNIFKYDKLIRIVDNEGSIVKRAAKALDIINSLVSSKIHNRLTTEVQDYQNQYNTKQYNFNIKINGVDLAKYNQQIDFDNNLHNIFSHHVAKHLYSVFDFKPLETMVLAPMQKNEKRTITVYPSAGGKTTAQYSLQEGKEYRKLQYNSRKGYNEDAIFRSEMDGNDTKDILQKKIINHVIISLIPFEELKIGCTQNENQEGMKEILSAFVELVRNDYKNSKDCYGKNISLTKSWEKQITDEYVRYNESINLTGVSEPAIDNYEV
ncbi:hypothetical protein [Candidatus Tisiphia endosymbiont of Dascillus cervinus]|uniref:hypothetical protein n=1 Tax=Candidatus Tisiphia endosymbiont of Dascillus cervinus TaxID=3066253 RepID=UPI00312CB25A